MEFCEAYSGKCVTQEPIPTAGLTPRGPVDVNLPATGFTYGFLLTIALIVIMLGTAITVAVKR